MTGYMIKDGWVVDPILNKVEKKNLCIKNNKFSKYENIPDGKTISAKGKYIMPGLFDLRCHLKQPGISFQKSVDSINKKALSGGFTSILAMPALSSMADNPETIKYVQDSIIKKNYVNLYFSGSLTMESKGKKLAPLGSLKEAGIVAVTDCPYSAQDNQIYCKASEYASMFNLPIMELPRDMSLSPGASAHESLLSLKMGLKGFPRMAEELFVSRSILLSKYTNAKIHLTSLSSSGSVQLVRKAKEDGVNITCDVNSNHLFKNENNICNFDSLSKALPPLREEEDRKSLIKGIINNTIDAISSGHQPFSFDDKSREFDLAPAGTLGLENAFHQVIKILDQKIEEKLLLIARKMAINPSKILQLEYGEIKLNKKANFFIYDPNGKTVIKRRYNEIGSANLPFEHEQFDGKITHTFVNGKLLYTN